MKPICWYWDSQLKTLQTSQNLSWPQIDFEEYDESGAARQRWRAAVDAVDGTAGGEGWGSAVMFLGLHPYSLKGDIKGIYMVYNYIVYKSGNYIYIYIYIPLIKPVVKQVLCVNFAIEPGPYLPQFLVCLKKSGHGVAQMCQNRGIQWMS